MRQKVECDSSSDVECPSTRLTEVGRLDRADASKVVSSLIEQVRKGDWSAPLNVKATVASLGLAQVWLQQESDLASMLSEAYESMEDVVRSTVDFEWLFEPGGEPAMDLISSEVFEILVELRVLADRLQRVGVVK